MKRKSPFAGLAILLLVSACMTPVGSSPALELLGAPAPEDLARRTIPISPDTKWVNVTGGETIRFVVGDKSFAWYFNGIESASPFDLRRTAPPGVLDREVLAYVAPNPLYFGSRGGHGGFGGHGGGHR
jgi:hypothetical protein